MSNIEWSKLKSFGDSELKYCSAEVFGGDYSLYLTQTEKGWEANVNSEDSEVIEGTKLIKDLDDAKAYAESLFRGYITAQLMEMGEAPSPRFVSTSICAKHVGTAMWTEIVGVTELGLVYCYSSKDRKWTQL
jgi:hypothetical protein